MSKQEIQRALFGRVGRQRATPESLVLNSVLDFLNALPGCSAWRQNTGGARHTNPSGETRFVRYGQRGMSDISGVLRGLRLEVETKALGEEPTPLQYAWLDFIHSQGGVAFWCDSLDMCIEKLRVEYHRRGWFNVQPRDYDELGRS